MIKKNNMSLTPEEAEREFYIYGALIRPEIVTFALAMELKCRKKEHKGGWRGRMVSGLFHHFHTEVQEFDQALLMQYPLDKILDEAVDVANLAMMIVDNLKSNLKEKI